MKSSWICWLVAASLLAGSPAGAGKRDKRDKPLSPDELINVFLSPGKAQWLVGPIYRLATKKEVEAYLEIDDDEVADRFIAEFWSRRRPLEGIPGLSAAQQFERLSAEADRRFGEATYPGRRTDRGTVFILYGPPDKVDYRPARREEDGEIEVWYYKRPRRGLDGRAPRPTYSFIRDGDLTRFALGAELPRLVP